MAPGQTKTALNPKQLAVLARGAKVFNEGKYFEAHEDWEIGWRDLPLPDRPRVQAAILVCGVFVLLSKARLAPAERLARLAIERFAEAATASTIHQTECALVLPDAEERLLKFLARIQLGETDPLRLLSESSGLKAEVYGA